MKPFAFLAGLIAASVCLFAEDVPRPPVAAPHPGDTAPAAPKAFGMLKDPRTHNVGPSDRNPFSKMELQSTGQSGLDADNAIKAANDPMRVINDQREALDSLLEKKLSGVGDGHWISVGDVFWRVGETQLPEDIGLQGVEVTLTEVSTNKLYFQIKDQVNGKTGETQFALRRFSNGQEKAKKK